jgi:hypothetical protein
MGCNRYDVSGKSWAVQSTRNPKAAEGDNFAAVSCLSARDCTAVGSYANVSTLTEHWNGRSWSVRASPDPGAASHG